MSDQSQSLLFDNEIFKLEKREIAKNFLIYGKNLQIRRYSQKKTMGSFKTLLIRGRSNTITMDIRR